MKWESNSVVKMLDEYRKRPVLYNMRSPKYHNRRVRRKALEEIATIVSELRPGTTANEVKYKFRSLRSYFVAEYVKKKRSEKNGVSTDDAYQPSIFYYDQLLFLSPYLTQSAAEPVKEEQSINGSNIILNPDTSPTCLRGDPLPDTSCSGLQIKTNKKLITKVVEFMPVTCSYGEEEVVNKYMENEIFQKTEDTSIQNGVEEESSCSQDYSHAQLQKTEMSKRTHRSCSQNVTAPSQSPRENVPSSSNATSSSFSVNQRFGLVIGDMLDEIKDQEIVIAVKKQIMNAVLDGQARDFKKQK